MFTQVYHGSMKHTAGPPGTTFYSKVPFLFRHFRNQQLVKITISEAGFTDLLMPGHSWVVSM